MSPFIPLSSDHLTVKSNSVNEAIIASASIDKLSANTEKILITLTRAEADMIKEQEEEGLAGKAKKSSIESI